MRRRLLLSELPTDLGTWMTPFEGDWRSASVNFSVISDIPLPTEIGREELVKISLRDVSMSEDFDLKLIVK